jgi:hypothetical protein
MWCIWNEWNISFKDCKISAAELKIIMFKSLYAWMKAYNSPYFSSFTEILDLCSFFFFPSVVGLFCILLVYLGCAVLHFLMRLIYLLKKKKTQQ